jgi:hypothetical protein
MFELSESDIVSLINASNQNNYIPISYGDPSFMQDREFLQGRPINNVNPIDPAQNPEQITLRVLSLSEEAKWLINLCLNTPAEIIGLITTPLGKITRPALRPFLFKKWKSKRKVERVFSEIKNFLSEKI